MGERPEDKQEKGEEGKQPKKDVWPKHGFDGDPKPAGALCRECQKPVDDPVHFTQEDSPGGSGGEKQATA